MASLIESLVAQYGRIAVITVSPYMPDNSGDIFRWVVQIDGSEEHDLDVIVDLDPEDPKTTVMTLVRGEERVEIIRWDTKRGAAMITDTLGQILDRQGATG